jgi:hypothetical protein
MPSIWRFQFHIILLNFNDGIVFGQDYEILANTKIGNVECGMWYVGIWNVECEMLVCGMWNVICGYGYVGMWACDMWYVDMLVWW